MTLTGRLLPIAILGALFLSSCGYTTSSSLPGNLQSIHVSQFNNEIVYTSASSRNVYFPLLEVDARNAIIDRFQFDGNLRVSEKDKADLLLNGKLLDYERQGLRYSDSDVAEEYRIHVVVALELWDMSSGQLMWSESRFVGEATYFLSGAQAISEEAAVAQALDDLARRIVERTIENW